MTRYMLRIRVLPIIPANSPRGIELARNSQGLRPS